MSQDPRVDTYVSDLEATVGFYTELLGFVESFRTHLDMTSEARGSNSCGRSHGDSTAHSAACRRSGIDRCDMIDPRRMKSPISVSIIGHRCCCSVYRN